MTETRRSWDVTLLGYALLAVCFSAAVSFGSVDSFLVAIWVAALAPTAAYASLTSASGPMSLIFGASAVALCYVAVALIQTWSPPLLGHADPIWAEARALLGNVISDERIAVAGGQPIIALGPILAVVCALSLGIALGSRGSSGRWLLGLFARCGAAYAAVAIILFLYDPTHIFWFRKPGYLNELTGTFTGRNVAASFIGMFLILNVTEAAGAYGRALARSGARRFELGSTAADFWWPVARAGLCCLALVLTNSRAGIVLSLAMCGLSIWLVLRQRQRLDWKATGSVGIAVLVAGLLLTSVGQVQGRIGGQGFDDEGRVETYKATLEMIKDRPLLGAGLGTFVLAFPKYRSANSIEHTWDRAHSTVLEFAAETGVPLTLLTMAAWLVAVWLLGRAALARGRRSAVGPLSVLVLLQLHSLIDFPLQIPGCALTCAAICGIGLGATIKNDHFMGLKAEEDPDTPNTY